MTIPVNHHDANIYERSRLSNGECQRRNDLLLDNAWITPVMLPGDEESPDPGDMDDDDDDSDML
jgi:hypothetical protein